MLLVTVSARDQFNNVATAEQGDITLAGTGSVTGIGSFTFVNGLIVASVRDTVVETVTLSLTDSDSLGIDVSTTKAVDFTPGVAVEFVIVQPSTSSVDVPRVISIRAVDQFGNTATDFSEDVSLRVESDDFNFLQLVNINSGVGSLSFQVQKPQSIALSLVDSEGTGLIVTSTQTAIVTAGAATSFIFLGASIATAGDSPSIQLEARDAFDNLAVFQQGSVTVLVNGASPIVATVTNGTASATVTTNLAETLTLTLSPVTGLDMSATLDVVFIPGTCPQILCTFTHHLFQDRQTRMLSSTRRTTRSTTRSL